MGFEPITCCSQCAEPFDVYRAPGERICEECRDRLNQCDCCGKPAILSRTTAHGIETFACVECQS